MKKVLLFTAAVLLSSIGFLSCNKNGGGSDEPQKDPAHLVDPVHTADALTIDFKEAETIKPITIDKYKVIPKKVIFTESGRYVFTGTIQEITKAQNVGDIFTKTGLYSRNTDGSYQMPGVGSVSTGATSGSTQTNLTDNSGNTNTYNSTVTDAPSTSGQNETNLVRSWIPEGNVHVEIPSKGISTNVGASLEAIAKYLAEHDVNINVSDYVGYNIEDITLSMADQSFIIAFKNGQAYLGNWSWSNMSAGQFSYNFSSQMAGELISGSASGSVSFYSMNSVNKCDFIMSITAKGITASLTFTLREK